MRKRKVWMLGKGEGRRRLRNPRERAESLKARFLERGFLFKWCQNLEHHPTKLCQKSKMVLKNLMFLTLVPTDGVPHVIVSNDSIFISYLIRMKYTSQLQLNLELIFDSNLRDFICSSECGFEL
jgi:hypothetical protein